MLYLLLLDEAIVAGVPSRPQIMGVDAQLPAVYLEERLVRKNFVRGGGSDKWKNSGGSKGASVFPLEGPRLACKYGSVTAADAEAPAAVPAAAALPVVGVLAAAASAASAAPSAASLAAASPEAALVAAARVAQAARVA